ncbi:hypothetical protein Acr_00g0060050 [Actinidia rufa]|uniref:PLAC8 family protein n=1 Tax=Actinidia rufa TaxID=165716 RepID=A0A7J0DQ78_9ERIC|nr:hypothetical protein Acr_00g0060050 [Actinidia rufa]
MGQLKPDPSPSYFQQASEPQPQEYHYEQQATDEIPPPGYEPYNDESSYPPPETNPKQPPQQQYPPRTPPRTYPPQSVVQFPPPQQGYTAPGPAVQFPPRSPFSGAQQPQMGTRMNYVGMGAQPASGVPVMNNEFPKIGTEGWSTDLFGCIENPENGDSLSLSTHIMKSTQINSL